MTRIPTKQIVREDGLLELPIVLDFDFSDVGKVVGHAVVDPDLLPSGTEYCFSLGYVKHDDGRTDITCLSVTSNDSYFADLRQKPDRMLDLALEFTNMWEE